MFSCSIKGCTTSTNTMQHTNHMNNINIIFVVNSTCADELVIVARIAVLNMLAYHCDEVSDVTAATKRTIKIDP